MNRLIDIGGSGVKTAKIRTDFNAEDFKFLKITHFPNPDWGGFIRWVNENQLLDSENVGISSAGFIKK